MYITIEKHPSCECLFPSYTPNTYQNTYIEQGKSSPYLLSLTTAAIGGGLLGFTAFGFECTDCPLTGLTIGSVIGVCGSIISIFAHIYCHKVLVTEEQIHQYRCNLICSTVISVVGLILNSIALSYYSNRCAYHC